jgi:outer membrane protein TolC
MTIYSSGFLATIGRTAAVAGLAVLLPTAGRAQSPVLTLRDALDRATASAVANRTARAAQDEARAGHLGTWRAILPTLRIDAGMMRTTDPVGAFGTTLRQQRIASSDFDPQRLNFPAPINNFTGALVIEQPLIVPDGWFAAQSTARLVDGATHVADWIEVTTQADVIGAWFGATLSAERATTMAEAVRAAKAHEHQADVMLEAGLVTRSDVLLASARVGEFEAGRLDAASDSILARRHLAVLIGEGPEAISVSGRFPDDGAVESLALEVLALTPKSRADVEGARSAVSAAAADAARARASLVPRVVSFARRDLNSAERPFGGSSSWSVGVMASWSPFSGAAELSDGRASKARRAAATAQLDGAAAAATVDLERTAMTLRARLAQLALARTSVAHGQEAHRIVTRRYEGGLATVAELLDAAAAETRSRLTLSAARHAVLTAIADRLRATGHEPRRMAVLGDARQNVGPTNDGPSYPND